MPSSHLEAVRQVPYTGSELCVHLGVDPRRVDLGRMRAEHLYMAGIYAATELFLGGVPTALQTGSLAADRVLGR